jgi:hypothetical protein
MELTRLRSCSNNSRSAGVQSGVNQALKLVGQRPAVGVPRVGGPFTCDGFYPHDQSIVAQFTAAAI